MPSVLAEHYKVQRLLGRGGMATVYLCTDERDGQSVAVKILREELGSAVTIERFLREIDFASELDHPQIPKVLDSGVIGELPFYAMTYIDGESLGARLKREKQLPIDDAVRIACAAMEPMTYAHARGIVHRDIKPENILLSGDKVYVLDFGVARAIVESAADRITSTGIAVGTPAYMSPEQALGDRDLDFRSDIYSLGCVLYEMIAGIPPFVGPTAQVVMSRRFVGPPPPLREFRDSVPEAVEEGLAKALEKNPADRWASAAEFRSALISPSSGVVASRFTTVSRRLRKRKRLVAAALGIPIIAASMIAAAALLGLLPGGSEQRSSLDPRRIAVLYFDDHSEDRSLGYLANGLTESLIHELSGVSAIQVVSRNGVKPFRDTAVPMDSIVNTLRVGSVVEGSVQRSGSRIRVTAQVVDARTSTPLESVAIERELADLFELEDALAQEVAGMLRKRIGREVRVREAIAATSSSRARDLMFRAAEAREVAKVSLKEGDSATISEGFASLRLADSLLASAESADRKWIGPVIARGWVSFDAATHLNGREASNSFRNSTDHADRALARDANSAAALELRGRVAYTIASRLPLGASELDSILRKAESDLTRAIALDPTLASAWGTLSRVHVALGELTTAERDARSAFAADAYLEDAPNILGALYLAALMGDSLESSWRYCLRGGRDFPRDPRFIDCHLTLLAEDTRKPPDPRLAWRLVADGMRVEPPASASSAGRPYLPTYRMMLGAIVSARAGRKDSARAVAARARASLGSSDGLATDFKYDDAFLHVVLGDHETAIQLLSEYLKERPSLTRLVAQHPRWRPLQTNPRFSELVRPNISPPQ